jgi:arginine/lysine/ornithine decarboxylase
VQRGAALHAKLRRLLGGQDAARHDLTELSGLDYLSSPGGPILGAQQAAAAAFGADHTWFLVNGWVTGCQRPRHPSTHAWPAADARGMKLTA